MPMYAMYNFNVLSHRNRSQNGIIVYYPPNLASKLETEERRKKKKRTSSSFRENFE